jgi:ComF family protein
MNYLKSAADDLLWLLFPELCASCGRPLFRGEECICTFCRYKLPKTHFHLVRENPVVKHFWGKIPVAHATSYYHFSKGEKVQKLIHQLKYKGREDVGVFIGKSMGIELKSWMENSDLIIPVPLHAQRLKKRGYNQSECFANGLAKGSGIEVNIRSLIRDKATETQTAKHRFERYTNMENVFSVKEPAAIYGKNILLVDDVITTGSTLIACAEKLLEAGCGRINIAAIAAAQ